VNVDLNRKQVFWCIFTMVMAIALVLDSLFQFPIWKSVLKQSASTGFIITGIVSGGLHSRYGKIILAGLVFSWFGDAFLLGSGQLNFLSGLVSFLLAHVLYCVAFFKHGFSLKWVLRSLFVIAPFCIVVLLWLLPNVEAAMLGPVIVYITVITIMVILAWGCVGEGGTRSIGIGAVLFYLSDISVAHGQFIDSDVPMYVWGLPCYFAGQLFLAVSVGSRELSTMNNEKEEI
jgi:uncharacterized membrane protein YhhN